VNGIVFVTFVPMKRCSECLNTHARYTLQGAFIIKRENESRSRYFVITRRRVAAPSLKILDQIMSAALGLGTQFARGYFYGKLPPSSALPTGIDFPCVFFIHLFNMHTPLCVL
jgi:GT2 family glycosyltransferase